MRRLGQTRDHLVITMTGAADSSLTSRWLGVSGGRQFLRLHDEHRAEQRISPMTAILSAK
jgi:hypothetical protein